MSDPTSPSSSRRASRRASSSSPRPLSGIARGASLAAAVAAGIVSLAHDAHAVDVEISFTEVPGATAYRLYYDNDDADPPYEGYQAEEGFSPVEVLVADMPDPAAPSISLTGMPSCERFYFAVTAMTGASESPYSTPMDAMLAYRPTPVTTAPNGPGSLLVGWAPLPDNDWGHVPTYRIEFDTDSGEPYDGAGSPVDVPWSSLPDPDDPSHPLTGLTPGATYYLVVESLCDGEDGVASDEVSAVAPDGTGGSGGTGAAGGTGGTGATGGIGGSGAATTGGTGGTGPGAGGVGVGASGASDADGGSDSESGCGCRMPGGDTTPTAWFVVPALLGLVRTRRRR